MSFSYRQLCSSDSLKILLQEPSKFLKNPSSIVPRWVLKTPIIKDFKFSWMGALRWWYYYFRVTCISQYSCLRVTYMSRYNFVGATIQLSQYSYRDYEFELWHKKTIIILSKSSWTSRLPFSSHQKMVFKLTNKLDYLIDMELRL